MKKENIIKYGNPILALLLVAVLGTLFTTVEMDWFETLNKPSRWINMAIIPIVWTIIYTLCAFYLVHLTKENKLHKTLKFYLIINGILNVLWCLVFFTLKNTLLGLVVIDINLLSSFFLLKEVFDTNKKWGYVLMIYPTWLTIATCLNLATWILN